MQKYHQFQARQGLIIRGRNFARYAKEFVTILTHSTGCWIWVESYMDEFEWSTLAELVDEILIYRENHKIDITIDMKGLNFYVLEKVTPFKPNKIKFLIGETFLKLLVEEDARAKFKSLHFQAETVELINGLDYPVRFGSVAKVEGKTYAFSKSNNREEEIYEFLNVNFKSLAEQQEEARRELEELRLEEAIYEARRRRRRRRRT